MTHHPDYRPWVSDPATCTWVSASAGTGKTKVLTDRVLSLLLSGAAPEKILCLTFTRAAAGEMTNRLYSSLSRWSILDDSELAVELSPLSPSPPTKELLTHARKLFSCVLEARGGMKIMTIHGFCQALLKRFPLEANLPPHFQVSDEQTTKALFLQSQKEVLQQHPNHNLQITLANLAEIFEENSFKPVVGHLISKRHHIDPRVLQNMQQPYEQLLQISLAQTEQDILAAACDSNAFAEMDLRSVIGILNSSTKTDQGNAAAINHWLQHPHERLQFIEQYKKVYLTQAGQMRKKLASTSITPFYPNIATILQTEAERLIKLQQDLAKQRVGRISWSCFSLGSAMLARYEELKSYRSVLDYDDLIAHAGRLLAQPDIAPWVLYKLDGGLDHILIDEAQDTSSPQWQVVATLAEEFFAGHGSRPDTPRTIFVVGDVKQSIYSFQGADPKVFNEMRQHFAKLVTACAQPWQEISLTKSFRSTEAVLQVVDQVFQQDVARNGVVHGEEVIQHIAHRQGHGGLVELWPLVKPDQPETPEPWSMPVVKTAPQTNPAQQLAQTLAKQIHHWITTKEILESQGRPIQPGDIMILVQRRTAFVDALIKELKQHEVPIAGNDRLALTKHLAVQDLMALGQFLLLPRDDLTLATVLKSPIIGLSEEQLFYLAHDREDMSLWQMLQENKDDNPQFEQAHDKLEGLIQQAKYLTPYQLFAQILGPGKGKRAIIARLGYDALDPLEEFLNLALAYEKNNVPSLQHFLTWLAEGAIQIKRDLDQGGQNQVRIMTVHGSKGLQAPIVILPDTTRVPKIRDPLLWHATSENHKVPFWHPPAEAICEFTGALKNHAQYLQIQEYNRLLYVAMTRAEDRLYVCGWRSKLEPSELCWYLQIKQALQEVGEKFALDDALLENFTNTKGWRLVTKQQLCQVEQVANEVQHNDELPGQLPLWAKRQATHQATTQELQRPSQLQDSHGEPALSPLTMQKSAPMNRGTIIHKLLQYLPDVPPTQRELSCRNYLARYWQNDITAVEELTQEIMQILNDPSFAAVFAPGSYAEVSLINKTSDRRLSGQVDRLVVTPHEVLVVDYKSDRTVADRSDKFPEKYLRQLQAYRECLLRLYPNHRIRCALLWTSIPRMDVVPEEMIKIEMSEEKVKASFK